MSPCPLRPVVTIRVFATDHAGRILLLRRASTEHGDGEWCPPGDQMFYGQSPEQTVAKELFEETGLAAREMSCTRIFPLAGTISPLASCSRDNRFARALLRSTSSRSPDATVRSSVACARRTPTIDHPG